MCLWWCGCLWLGLDLVGGRASQTLCARLTLLGSSRSVTSVLHRQHQWSSTLLLVQLLLLSTTLSSTTLTAFNLSASAFNYSSENGQPGVQSWTKTDEEVSAHQITMATHQSTHQIFLFESFCLCLLLCCLALLPLLGVKNEQEKCLKHLKLKL